MLEIKHGVIVRHFKHWLVSEDLRAYNPLIYCYRILGLASHTSGTETLVIYEALYNYESTRCGDMFARPINEFLSLVDETEYPNTVQKSRFEAIGMC